MREVYKEGDLISVSLIMLYSTCGCMQYDAVAALRSEKSAVMLRKQIKGCYKCLHLAMCTLASLVLCQVAYVGGHYCC